MQLQIAWLLEMELPLGSERLWTGGIVLSYGDPPVEYRPVHGFAEIGLPQDRIGGGYDHGTLVLTWPVPKDGDVIIREFMAGDIGIEPRAPVSIRPITRIPPTGDWRAGPPEQEFHGFAQATEWAPGRLTMDLTPLLGDLDSAQPIIWSADARRSRPGSTGREGEDAVTLEPGMRFMRRSGKTFLGRFPGGPTQIDDDFVQ